MKDKEQKVEEGKHGEEQLEEIDNSVEASAVSPQMAKISRWNIPGLYQQKAHRLLRRITENSDILSRNENGEAVVDGDAIPNSYFKSLFK